MTTMMRENVSRATKRKSIRPTSPFAYGAAAIVILILLVSFFPNEDKKTNTIKTMRSSVNEIIEGESKTSPAIPYYLCGNPRDPHVVLLHGARFTKANWEQSGIMKKLCKRGVSVSALNLTVRSKHEQLLEVLEALAAEYKLSVPMASIVTPSASGFTIIDGILNGKVQTMQAKISSWIPVASPDALNHQASELAVANGWPMLAVYGDKDEMGKQSSQKWADVANAKVVELQGSHPVYLDSPDDFVETVIQFLKDQNLLT